MRPIAILSSANMLADHPDVREDDWEHAWQMNAIRPACRALGLELRVEIWDDPAFDPSGYDAVVIGTTWDYTQRPNEFLDALARFAGHTRLFNPLSVVRWNLEKTYLRDLATRGAPVVPTVWTEAADATSIQAAFDALDADEIVVKPQVGASAWRQVRLRRGDEMPTADALPPAATMIQPYLPAVASEGEYSFLFFGDQYSHCARKVPKPGDYRVQSIYGAKEEAHEPSSAELKAARAVLALVEGPWLYARVDMIRDPSGQLVLIELELIEPYYYPAQGPGMGAVFATALEAALG